MAVVQSFLCRHFAEKALGTERYEQVRAAAKEAVVAVAPPLGAVYGAVDKVKGALTPSGN